MAPTTVNMHYEVDSCGDEKNKIIIIDNFHPDPAALFLHAQTEPYFTAQVEDFYPGKRKPVDGKYPDYLADSIESLLRDTYNIAANQSMSVGLCTYSLTTKTERQLRPIQCIPHIDTHDNSQFAVV